MTDKMKKQLEADRRWTEKNTDHKRCLSYRSTARLFTRNRATLEDLEELKEIIEEKEKKLKK